jgi:TetR/AcrR family transcriptional repressor of nem operon
MSAREKLVEATRELLWSRGYTATSPKAILDAAGVGQGSMYHHFKDKEALAVEAIRVNQAELRAMIEADLTIPGSAVDRIERYLLKSRDVLKGCRFGRLAQDPQVIDSEALRTEVDEMFGWMCSRVGEAIVQGQADGDIPEDLDAGDIAATVVAVVEGGYVLARARNDPEAFTSAARGAVQLLRRAGVHGPDQGRGEPGSTSIG